MSPTNPEIIPASRLMRIALDQLNADTKARVEAIVAAAIESEGRGDEWHFDLKTMCWLRKDSGVGSL